MKNKYSLKIKISIILVILLFSVTIMSFFIEKLFIFSSFLDLEKKEAIKDMKRNISAIKREIYHIDLLVNDWAMWDDTYKFVKNKNKDFIKSNLVESTFTAAKINFLFIINKKGNIIYKNTVVLNPYKEIIIDSIPIKKFKITHALLNHKSDKSSISGIFITAKYPILISSRPIVTSNGKGPNRGTIIFGNFLNKKFIKKIADQSRSDLSITFLAKEKISKNLKRITNTLVKKDKYFIEYQNNKLNIFSIMNDISDKPALLIHLKKTRNIITQGKKSLSYARISMILGIIFLFILIIIILIKAVLKPIKILTNHAVVIGKNDCLEERLNYNSKDEIGILVREFNNMLEKLSNTRKKLIEESYKTGKAEMAVGALHNIGNSMAPIVIDLESIKENLENFSFKNCKQAIKELLDNKAIKGRENDLLDYLNLFTEKIETLHKTIDQKINKNIEKTSSIEKLLLSQSEIAKNSSNIFETFNWQNLIENSIFLISNDMKKNVVFNINPKIKNLKHTKGYRIIILQVLHNILVNAIEATINKKDNIPKIIIDIAEEYIDTVKYYSISIIDNGEGISKKYIFLWFFY